MRSGGSVELFGGTGDDTFSGMTATKRDHKLSRSSGVLLHPTSLPGGVLDREALRFVDWLAAAGQSWWQILPLGPPDEHGSPYRSASAFAAWSGLLAKPRVRVTAGERPAVRARDRGRALGSGGGW